MEQGRKKASVDMKRSNKILYGSFLVALLPVFLPWFRIGYGTGIRPPWRGIYIMRWEFYLVVALYYVMVFLKKRWGVVAAHFLTGASYVFALSRFTIRTHISETQNWKFTLSTLQWTFWLAIGAIATHLLFSVLWIKKRGTPPNLD